LSTDLIFLLVETSKKDGENVGKGAIEKFGLRAIANALEGSDVATARAYLSELVGAAMEVLGKVQK
jgi:hypothetical protein